MLAIPSRLGDFILKREIGRGGMGVVFLALQESLGRKVALKVLPREPGDDPERLARFQREAASISRLDHPGIVPVYGVGCDQGVHFIAMKLIRGCSLDALIRKRRSRGKGTGKEQNPRGDPGQTLVLGACPSAEGEGKGQGQRTPAAAPSGQTPPGEEVMTASEVGWIFRCLRIAEKVAWALDHAHRQGLIHRDVKPGNILIDEAGEPCLLDFGLVRDMGSLEKSLTLTGNLVGTSFYLAPEQVRQERERVDQRVDIYALGVTLYEMTTLRRPFPQTSPDSLLHAIVNDEPVPPRRVNPGLPRDVETVILKAMEKDPRKRYQSAALMARDLNRVRRFAPVMARRISPLARLVRWVRKKPALAAALLFAALSFLGMVEYTVYRARLESRRAQAALTRGDLAYFRGETRRAWMEYRLYEALGGGARRVTERLQRIKQLGQQGQEPQSEGN